MTTIQRRWKSAGSARFTTDNTMTNTTSNTPRTDAAIIHAYDDSQQPFTYVSPDFARTLESETQALGAENARLKDEADKAKREAVRLAVGIWRAEFQADAPNWQPLDYVAGIISQIDNMYAGVRGQRDEARFERNQLRTTIAALEEKLAAANKHAEYWETGQSSLDMETLKKDLLEAQTTLAEQKHETQTIQGQFDSSELKRAQLEADLQSLTAVCGGLKEALAKEERACSEEIANRDHREDVINRLCTAAGHAFSFDFEWTSHYGFEDAIRDVWNKHDALKAEVEARKKDSEILDWLEANLTHLNHFNRKAKKAWAVNPSMNYEYDVFPTLREAVDAALSRQEERKTISFAGPDETPDLRAQLAEARRERDSSNSIREAEKKILIAEIEKCTQLRASLTALKAEANGRDKDGATLVDASLLIERIITHIEANLDTPYLREQILLAASSARIIGPRIAKLTGCQFLPDAAQHAAAQSGNETKEGKRRTDSQQYDEEGPDKNEEGDK